MPAFPCTVPPGATSPEQRSETRTPSSPHPPPPPPLHHIYTLPSHPDRWVGRWHRCLEFRQALPWGGLPRRSGGFSHLRMPPRRKHRPRPCGHWRERRRGVVLGPPHLALAGRSAGPGDTLTHPPSGSSFVESQMLLTAGGLARLARIRPEQGRGGRGGVHFNNFISPTRTLRCLIPPFLPFPSNLAALLG